MGNQHCIAGITLALNWEGALLLLPILTLGGRLIGIHRRRRPHYQRLSSPPGNIPHRIQLELSLSLVELDHFRVRLG